MSSISTEVENIADAISSCDAMAEFHASSARRILLIVMMLTMILILFLLYVILLPVVSHSSDILPDAALYVVLAFYALTFSVLMAVYRLHIGETSRLQHYKVGFIRVRIAGSNPSLGYQSEVRTTLTKGAFEFPTSSERKAKIGSPAPGHPGSDFATTVANKVLDGIASSRKSLSIRPMKIKAKASDA